MKRYILFICLAGFVAASAPLFANEAKLINAAKKGNLKIVQELISREFDPETADSSGRTLVMLAALNGKYSVVDYLLDLDVNPNRRDKKGYTLMHILAGGKSRDALAVAEKAIKQRGDVNYILGKGDTPLSIAIQKGNLAMVELFLEKGNCTPDTTVHRMPIALYAYSQGRAPVMKAIIERGAKLNAAAHNGYTLLTYAIKKNDLATVSYLIEKGASIEVQYSSMTPVIYAARLGSYKIMQLLMDKGADVMKTDDEGQSLLHILASGKNNGKTISSLNIPERLLNRKDREGMPAVVLAVLNKRWDSVRALVEKGAEIDYSDSEGKNLLLITLDGGSVDTALLFIDKGISVTRKDRSGVSPLHIAAGKTGKAWNSLMIKMIQSGADVNDKDNSLGTPAGRAIDGNNTSGFKILCDNGLDINSTEKGNDPLIIYAYKKNRKFILDELIKRGASLAVKDSGGNTLLHVMAMKNDTQMYKKMQTAGFDVNAGNSTGKTPLFLAVENNSYLFAQLLLGEKESLDLKANDSQGMNIYHYLASMKKGEKLLALIEVDEVLMKKADKDGRTPIAISVNQGLVPHAAFFLSHGADASGEDWTGCELVVTGYSKGRAMMNLLLENGADPEAVNPDGKNLLFMCIEKGDLQTLTGLINLKVDINRKYRDGTYPLIHAIYKKNSRLIRLLIDSGADTNVKDENGNTPLVAAVESKDIKIAEYLIKGGANVNVTNSEGKKLILVSYEKNSIEVFKLLISGGAMINEAFEGKTLLHITVTANRFSFAYALIKGGADINARDADGKTALMIAAEKGYTGTGKVLVAATTDFTLKDNTGETVLYKSLKTGNGGCYTIADLVLKGGAAADGTCPDGKPLLIYAAESGKFNFVSLLLKYGSDPNVTSSRKETAIYILSKTVMTGSKDKYKSDQAAKVIAELVSKGGDPNLADRYGRTPLDMACRRKNTVIAGVLIKAGATVDAQDGNGNTSLKKVIMDYTGDYKVSEKEKKAALAIIDLLIKNGAQINIQDKFGRNALAHICKEANDKNRQKIIDIVPELISRGARADIADSDGKTAADYAAVSNIDGLIDLVR